MREKGFTITELMIVVAVMGILTVVAAPNLSRWSTGLRMNSSVKEIASELQLARIKAITQNTDVTLCFYTPSADFPKYTNGFFSLHIDKTWCAAPPSSPGQAFERFKATVSPLPPGITVVSNPDNSFVFNSRGQVKAGNIVFSRPDPSDPQTPIPKKKIKIHYTGRVRLCDPPTDSNC